MVPDEERIERAAHAHLPALRAFVRLRMGDALAAREMSVDIVQSVFKELLANSRESPFESEAALRKWLFTAAVHKIKQRARYHAAAKRDRRRERNEPMAGLEELADVLTPSRAAIAREELHRLEAALQALSPRYREIISLVRIAGWSHEQAAEHFDITVSGSRALLRRALIKLAEQLEPDGVPDDDRPDAEHA